MYLLSSIMHYYLFLVKLITRGRGNNNDKPFSWKLYIIRWNVYDNHTLGCWFIIWPKLNLKKCKQEKKLLIYIICILHQLLINVVCMLFIKKNHNKSDFITTL